jgi:hypothetical protein
MVALTACQRLQEADQAYHDLLRGAAVRSVSDESGENISFTQAKSADLLLYIINLQQQCTTYQATAINPTVRRPMTFLFG